MGHSVTSARTPRRRPGALLRKFLARSSADRRLLLEALGSLALARMATLLLPFRWVVRWCGEKGGESPECLPEMQQLVAGRVGWAVVTMARHVPWNGLCLTQALAATRMLRRRGIPGTVYFGVRKGAPGPRNMAFHAWLRCGATFVTGGDCRLTFQVLALFGRKE